MSSRILCVPMGNPGPGSGPGPGPDPDPEPDIVWIDADPSAPTADSAAITTRQMSERFNLPARTLRFYASKGLLAPTRSGRERLYGPLDQIHLTLILKGRRLGFTLDEIGQMIAVREGRGSPSVLNALRQKCLDRIQQLESRLSKITEVLTELRSLHMSL